VRAVVLGGGIAGLYSARVLAGAGHSVDLFEASDRLGGLIQPATLGSVTFDIGAEAFAVSRPDALALIADLGLETQLVEPANSEARILANGRAFKIPHGFLGIPSNLDSADLLEAIGADGVAEAQRLDAAAWNVEPGGTLGQLVSQRLGDAVLENLVTPVVAGVHASHPSLLEADVVAPGLFAKAKQLGSLVAAAAEIRASAARPGAAVAGLSGGMHGLIRALRLELERLGVSVHLGVAAESVAAGESGYRVTFANGQSAQYQVAVLATPPAVSAKLLAAAPGLAEPLGALRAVDVTVVALIAQNRYIGRAPLGSGVLVAPGEPGVTAKASTHATAKWDWLHQALGEDMHLIRLSYGRDGASPKASDDLLRVARQDAAALFGLDAVDVIDAVIQEWPGSLIQARVGHRAALNALAAAQQKFPNLAIVGAGLGGNGITGILAKAKEQLSRIGD